MIGWSIQHDCCCEKKFPLPERFAVPTVLRQLVFDPKLRPNQEDERPCNDRDKTKLALKKCCKSFVEAAVIDDGGWCRSPDARKLLELTQR